MAVLDLWNSEAQIYHYCYSAIFGVLAVMKNAKNKINGHVWTAVCPVMFAAVIESDS